MVYITTYLYSNYGIQQFTCIQIMVYNSFPVFKHLNETFQADFNVNSGAKIGVELELVPTGLPW